MKTRKKLKYAAIALLVETVLLSMKQPASNFLREIESFDLTLSVIVVFYYNFFYKIVRVVLYGIFVYLILNVENKYKHHVFGHFFVADWAVCVLDAFIVFFLLWMPDLALTVRHYTEVVLAIATASTSFLAGTFLYSKIRSEAFRTIRTAYRLWALRYLIYALVLLGELAAHNHWHIGYLEMASYDWWVITSWCLRMPLMILSRCVLLYGVLQIKSAKEIHDEHKSLGKSHHHRHSKSDSVSLEQTMDS